MYRPTISPVSASSARPVNDCDRKKLSAFSSVSSSRCGKAAPPRTTAHRRLSRMSLSRHRYSASGVRSSSAACSLSRSTCACDRYSSPGSSPSSACSASAKLSPCAARQEGTAASSGVSCRTSSAVRRQPFPARSSARAETGEGSRAQPHSSARGRRSSSFFMVSSSQQYGKRKNGRIS